jgi:hypothetical protein
MHGKGTQLLLLAVLHSTLICAHCELLWAHYLFPVDFRVQSLQTASLAAHCMKQGHCC